MRPKERSTVLGERSTYRRNGLGALPAPRAAFALLRCASRMVRCAENTDSLAEPARTYAGCQVIGRE